MSSDKKSKKFQISRKELNKLYVYKVARPFLCVCHKSVNNLLLLAENNCAIAKTHI
jgi:hypothetical protein